MATMEVVGKNSPDNTTESVVVRPEVSATRRRVKKQEISDEPEIQNSPEIQTGDEHQPEPAAADVVEDAATEYERNRPSQEELDRIFTWLRAHIMDLPTDIVIEGLWPMVDLDAEDAFRRVRELIAEDEEGDAARHFFAEMTVDNWLLNNSKRAIDDTQIQRAMKEDGTNTHGSGRLGRIAGVVRGVLRGGNLVERNRMLEEIVNLSAQSQGIKEQIRRLKAKESQIGSDIVQREGELAAKAEAILAKSREDAQKGREMASKEVAELRAEADAYYEKKQREGDAVLDTARIEARTATSTSQARVDTLKNEEHQLTERVARLRGTIAEISEANPESARTELLANEQLRRQIVERAVERANQLSRLGLDRENRTTLEYIRLCTLGIDLTDDLSQMNRDVGREEYNRLTHEVVEPMKQASYLVAPIFELVKHEKDDGLWDTEKLPISMSPPEILNFLKVWLSRLEDNPAGLTHLRSYFMYLRSMVEDGVLPDSSEEVHSDMKSEEPNAEPILPDTDASILLRRAELAATTSQFLRTGMFEKVSPILMFRLSPSHDSNSHYGWKAQRSEPLFSPHDVMSHENGEPFGNEARALFDNELTKLRNSLNTVGTGAILNLESDFREMGHSFDQRRDSDAWTRKSLVYVYPTGEPEDGYVLQAYKNASRIVGNYLFEQFGPKIDVSKMVHHLFRSRMEIRPFITLPRSSAPSV